LPPIGQGHAPARWATPHHYRKFLLIAGPKNGDFTGTRYKEFSPAAPNVESAGEMKDYFRSNWKIHFSQLNYFVKGLSKKEFFQCLIIADETRIWEYARLEPFHLPYIFATLMDFPPVNSRKTKTGEFARKYYFRCFFDSSVQKYEDLWIERPKKLEFWRAWYIVPVDRKKPRVEDLLDAYSVEVIPDFLDRPAIVPSYYEDEIQDWINYHYPTKAR
jgi:hypothetical protein